MSQNTFDDKSTLVQVMAWCRHATSHYLSKYWSPSMSPYGAARTSELDKAKGYLYWYSNMASRQTCPIRMPKYYYQNGNCRHTCLVPSTLPQEKIATPTSCTNDDAKSQPNLFFRNCDVTVPCSKPDYGHRWYQWCLGTLPCPANGSLNGAYNTMHDFDVCKFPTGYWRCGNDLRW